ncbi:Rieske (2Fe-2S) protein [Natrinema soli]|uniref:Rieske (2Fe-2S) protein n=1 Tax=Natrinema soli TaxID=1930624 RepID=A0ABD5SNK7_9EURY|nr:Rieske 2Fe-2S domain-containing protein [Natrinema soli]
MARHRVAAAGEVSKGGSIGVEVDGLEIAVFNVDGDLYAVQNTCVHKEGPMYEAEVDEENRTVHCPWHYWEFKLETGEFVVDEQKQLRTFDVEVEDGEIWVKI